MSLCHTGSEAEALILSSAEDQFKPQNLQTICKSSERGILIVILNSDKSYKHIKLFSRSGKFRVNVDYYGVKFNNKLRQLDGYDWTSKIIQFHMKMASSNICHTLIYTQELSQRCDIHIFNYCLLIH